MKVSTNNGTPLHQSKVATILYITTASLADDNCACMNSMMQIRLIFNV